MTDFRKAVCNVTVGLVRLGYCSAREDEGNQKADRKASCEPHSDNLRA